MTGIERNPAHGLFEDFLYDLHAELSLPFGFDGLQPFDGPSPALKGWSSGTKYPMRQALASAHDVGKTQRDRAGDKQSASRTAKT
jgi:hypothetical protein